MTAYFSKIVAMANETVCSLLAVVHKCLQDDIVVFRHTIQAVVDELEVRRFPPAYLFNDFCNLL
jgi:hypothetical protein